MRAARGYDWAAEQAPGAGAGPARRSQIAEATCGLIKRECAARPDGAICRGLVDKYK